MSNKHFKQGKYYTKKWKSDIIYNSFWFSKLLSVLVKKGEKKRLENHIYNAAYNVQLTYGVSFIYIYFELLELIKPLLVLETGRYTKRVGRRLLQRQRIPVPLNYWAQYKSTIKWISQQMISNSGSSVNSLQNKVLHMTSLYAVISLKKEVLYSDLIQNRMFLQFRWHF